VKKICNILNKSDLFPCKYYNVIVINITFDSNKYYILGLININK